MIREIFVHLPCDHPSQEVSMKLFSLKKLAVIAAGAVLFFLLDPALFGALGPLWLFLYFSVTVNFSARLWKKPFDRYIKNAENQA